MHDDQYFHNLTILIPIRRYEMWNIEYEIIMANHRWFG